MKRKHLLLLTFLLSQTAPLWGMNPEENNLKLPIHKIHCGESDFENFGSGKIPTRQYCQKALVLSNLDDNDLNHTDRAGGNGVVSLTKNKKYAVKREVDINAGIPEKNKVDVLLNVSSTVNNLKRKYSNINGFVMNLPVNLFHIYKNNQPAKCNIQIFPQVKTPLEKEGRKDVAGIIRHYLYDSNRSLEARDLNTIKSLGKKLAEFQQTTEISNSNNIDIGLQHGDFNPANILITKINHNGEADFTLIDNGDFRVDGRIISDPVYFSYWTVEFLLSNPDSSTLNRFKTITNSFYSGYVEKLPEAVVKNMKKYIFDKGIIGPLAAAFSGDFFSFRGRTHFLNTEKWSKILAPMQHDGFLAAYSSRFIKRNTFNVVYNVYKVENKWHWDQKKSSSLDADSDHIDGRIYRSNSHNDNTFWYLTPQSNGSFKLENKWYRDQGKPSSLDADSDHRDGRIYRSNSHNDNTFWYLTPQSNGSFKLENKWYRDQGKPSSLDADSDHRDGRIYRSNSHNDNTFWYLTPVAFQALEGD